MYMCTIYSKSNSNFGGENKRNHYIFQSSPEFILNICTKVGLLISWDDNDSMRNEEVVGVVRFDGAQIGTKKTGVQQLVSN